MISSDYDITEAEIFDGLSQRRQMQLRRMAALKDFKKGDMLYLPGDTDGYVYVIEKGLVKIAKINDNGKELTLAIYSVGDLFGELTLVVDRPRRTQAISVVPSKIWLLPREEFSELVSATPVLAMNLSSIIGQRRHDLETRMENLVFRDVPARLASLLISLAEQYGIMRQGRIFIDMKLSQLELANFIGATRETTSTVINDLKRKGIVETRHRTIIINDIEEMKAVREAL